MSRRYASVRRIAVVWPVLWALAGASWGQSPPPDRPVHRVKPSPPRVKPTRVKPTEQLPAADEEASLDQYTRLLEAERLSEQGRHLEVLDLLAEAPAEQRHWEYGHLRSRAAGLALRKIATTGGLHGRFLAVDFSPEESLVAGAGTGGAVSLLDAATGTRVRTLRGHRLWVRCLKFHPNGKLLASGSDDGTVKLWRADIGLEIRELPQQRKSIMGVCFSPDGRTIATAGLDEAVKLWNLSDGKEILSLDGHAKGAGAVAYSPDGNRLATMSLNGEIFLWDASTGQQLKLLGDQQILQEVSIAFSPDGHRLACGYPGSAAVWDLETGEKTLSVGRASNGVGQVAFTPDGQGLLTARDHTVCLWDVATGRALSRMTGRTGPIHALALQGDGSRFALGGEGQVCLCATPVGDAHSLMGTTGARASCLGFGDNGEAVLAGGANGDFAWDLETGIELPSDRPPGRTLAFSADGTRVASVGPDRRLIIRGWNTGEVFMNTEPLQKKAPLAAIFTHDGTQLLTSEWNKTIRLWDVAKRRKVWSSPVLPGPAVSLALSPRGTVLAAAARDRCVVIYNLLSGEMVNEISMPATAVAFSKKGMLAAAGRDHVIRILEPMTGKVRMLLRGHEDYISSLAFTADGQRLASAAADGTVRVWAPYAGIELLTLEAGQQGFTAVAFSTEGGHLVAGDRQGQVHLWESDRVFLDDKAEWLPIEEVLVPALKADQPSQEKKAPLQKPAPIIRQ